MMGNRKAMIIIIIFVIVTCTCGCGSTGKYKELTVPVIAGTDSNYQLYKVKRHDIHKEITLDGTLIPAKEYSMCFYTSGAYIKSVNVKEGDMVEKGQVLAELDTDSINFRISLQEIRLKKMNLILENLISSNGKERDVKSVQLDIEKNQIILENLKKELANSKLISNVSGKVIGSEIVKAGNRVRMNQPVINIADLEQIQVECKDEKVGKLKIGMIAKIVYNDESINGDVAAIVEKGVENSSSKIARVNIDKLPRRYKFGEIVEVTISLGMRENVIAVPKNYVKSTDKYSIVQVWQKGSKVIRYVEIGVENDSEVEIVSGLKEDEEIVRFY